MITDSTVTLDTDITISGLTLAGSLQGNNTLTVNGPVWTGGLIAGIAPEQEYTATHAPVYVLEGYCYWLEITNTAADGSCIWFWELAQEGNGSALQDNAVGLPPPNGYDPSDRIPFDLAVQ